MLCLSTIQNEINVYHTTKVMDEPTLARFMAKVNKTETCWLWTASRNQYGYGVFRFNRERIRSHRLSYLHHHGEIPEGLVVRHKCRNKHCVNPDHLEVGTQKENIADKVRDGTDDRGEKSVRAKLSTDQVLDIRSRTGQTQQAIAKEFEVSHHTISRIRRRETWTHI